MADAAERLVEGRGWLPVVLRASPPAAPAAEVEATGVAPIDTAVAGLEEKQDGCAVAAE